MQLVKLISGVILVHAPGLVLMANIHWTWAVALILVLLMGIVGGLIVSALSSGFTWGGFYYQPPPAPPLTVTREPAPAEEGVHDLVRH